MREQVRRAARIVLAGWLLAWVVRAPVQVGWMAEAVAFPLELDFFPAALQSSIVSSLGLVLPVPAAVGALIWPRRWAVVLAGCAMAVCASLLLVHQDTYNDATYLTAFWSALYLLWLGVRVDVEAEDVAIHGPFLAQCVVSLVFLGGFVGKLTAGYWSGETLYHLYILQSSAFPWSEVREAASEATLRELARWFSRLVVVTEGALALTFLAPARLGLWGSAGAMGLIVLLSDPWLTSVMGSLVGVALAGTSLIRRPPTGS